jgi:hypothetical protein
MPVQSRGYGTERRTTSTTNSLPDAIVSCPARKSRHPLVSHVRETTGDRPNRRPEKPPSRARTRPDPRQRRSLAHARSARCARAPSPWTAASRQAEGRSGSAATACRRSGTSLGTKTQIEASVPRRRRLVRTCTRRGASSHHAFRSRRPGRPRPGPWGARRLRSVERRTQKSRLEWRASHMHWGCRRFR